MNGFEALATALVAEGVDTVFGMIGAGVDRLSAVLHSKHKVRYVKVRHEDVAVGMAHGYARATGKIGVAIVSSGPGLANCGASMLQARMAKVPVLLIAGGHSPGSSRHGNSLTDQPPFLKATIGAVQDCRTPETLSEDVALAFRHLRLGRGPIALHFYGPIAQAQLPDDWKYEAQGLSTTETTAIAPDPADVQDIVARIKKAKRPIILAGRGAHLAGAKSALLELSERIGALLATSLLARDMFVESPYSLGVSGGFAYGDASEIMKECDLLIGFGARLTPHTMSHGKVYTNAEKIQIDIDPAALEDTFQMDKVVQADARLAAQALLVSLKKIERPDWRGPSMAKRIKSIDRFKNRGLKEAPGKANHRRVVDACDKLLPKERIVSTDIGQFLGVPASYMSVQSPADLLYEWDLGRVGGGLAIAAGAAVGRPDRLVVAFLGDAGMMAAMHVLPTIKDADIPICIVVMDNNGFESERWIFTKTGDDMFTADYDTPELSKLANALGLDGYKVTSSDEMTRLLKSTDFRNRSSLIHVIVGKIYPIEMELSKGRPVPPNADDLV
jgi:thiamine pyrophosphate-dependent acetolactate synthase large subunit-like protein